MVLAVKIRLRFQNQTEASEAHRQAMTESASDGPSLAHLLVDADSLTLSQNECHTAMLAVLWCDAVNDLLTLRILILEPSHHLAIPGNPTPDFCCSQTRSGVAEIKEIPL